MKFRHLVMRLLLIPALTVLLLTGCRKAVEENGSAVQPPALVELYSCKARPYRNTIKGFGTIEPVRKAEILPPLSGTLTDMYFLEGELINTGYPLARLDTRMLKLQLSEQDSAREGALAAVRLAEENYRKARREMEGRFLSIRSAEAEHQKAQAEYHRMEEVFQQKKQLFQAGGIPEEDLQSAELALMEKETALQQSGNSLDSLKIGFRREDLMEAGINSCVEGNSKKTLRTLFIDLNTRMELAQWELAVAELNEAERHIASLELKIEECMIRSPLEGIVGRRYRDEGEMVSPDTPLYTLYPRNPVHALISLSERDLLQVKPGMDVDVTCDAMAGNRSGSVDRVSPWINSETRSGELRVLLENKDNFWRVGQFVRVEIALGERESRVHIPSSAIIPDSNRGERIRSSGGFGDTDTLPGEQSAAAVFLLKGGRIFRRELSLGTPEEGGIPVIRGLEAGDEIVLSPHRGLHEGMEVIKR